MKSLSNKIDDVLRNSSHLIWLNDYKTYGYRSYVYQDKNILHELYEDYNLCMNDDMIRDEAFDYIVELNKDIGKAISNFYGIDSKYELSLLHSINDVVNSSVAINAIFSNTTAMKFLTNKPIFINAINNSSVAIAKYVALLAGLNHASYSSMNDIINSETAINSIFSNLTAINSIFNSSIAINTLLNSSNAMNTITTNPIAIATISKSTSDWSKKKSFIMKLNEEETYIKNVYNILTNTKYFTKETSTTSTSYSTLNSYCANYKNESVFIACALGSYDKTIGHGTRLKINGDIIKESKYPNASYRPSSVNNSNVNAIAIPIATFEPISNMYSAIAIYKPI